MYIDGGTPDDNLDQVIEEVVQGAGNLENVLVNKGWRNCLEERPILAARATNIIRRLPGPKDAAKNAKTPLECLSCWMTMKYLK